MRPSVAATSTRSSPRSRKTSIGPRTRRPTTRRGTARAEARTPSLHSSSDIGKTIEIDDFTPLAFASNEDGDVFAIVRWAWRSRQTGKAAKMQLHHWWRVENGKISYFRGAEDTPATLAALG